MSDRLTSTPDTTSTPPPTSSRWGGYSRRTELPTVPAYGDTRRYHLF